MRQYKVSAQKRFVPTDILIKGSKGLNCSINIVA